MNRSALDRDFSPITLFSGNLNGRKSLLRLCLVVMFFSLPAVRTTAAEVDQRPNVVIIFTDDQGYGDVGCFGAKGYSTPNLDRLAAQGTKFTNFHVSQPVCSASRTSLLTGCYANRIGIHGALGPNAQHGINDEETVIAEVFKGQGYATGMAGKWHLGHHPQFLPTRHGFDEYLGLPYSNDMWPHRKGIKPGTYPNLPLIENETIIDEDVTADDQRNLTTMYAERAVSFIDRNHDKPFFFYLAHSMPHVPLYVSDKFQDKTEQGRYGDVIEEVDWSVGQILDALERHKIADNTLVIFTTDNGPWLVYGNHAGSAGPLREGKGTCWEGGVRVPCIMRWPGKIPAGAVSDKMLMTIDLLPTLAGIIGAPLPKRSIDGRDVAGILMGKEMSNPHDAYYFYFEQGALQAVTSSDGRWKLQLPHIYRTLNGGHAGNDSVPGKYVNLTIESPELYDLQNDIGEKQNVADEHPEIVKQLQEYAELARRDMGDSLTNRVGQGVREPGQVAAAK